MNVLTELKNFYDNFRGTKGVLGKSSKGKPIYFFGVIKSAYPVVIVQYAIHAREYITTYLAIEQIKEYLLHGKFGTVYFVPAVNPDGIEIALKGDKLWKANARGVDLNVNFDADWGKGAQNILYENSKNFIGKFPFSESETKALKNFTLCVRPNFTISYHSKGEEIYWEYFQDDKRLNRDYKIAKVIARSTGYPLVSVYGSCGGYKDWCIKHLKIPAVTVEVGSDSLFHPIEKDGLSDIYQKNKNVLLDVTNYFNGV